MNRPAIALLFLALASGFLSEVTAPANPTYTFTVNPSVPLSCGGTVTLTLSLTNAQNNQAYNVVLEVLKPNGAGNSRATRTINTNNAGQGSTVVPYPDPSFTPINGTIATDVEGVYTVIANQTSPTNLGTVTTTQFTVSCQLTVVITDPLPGTLAERGRRVTISATVSDLSGTVSSAVVKANSPSGGEIVLSQTSPGAYSIDYQVLLYDPVGTWTIRVQALDINGNSGTSNSVNVSVVRSELIVYSLSAYNSKGLPTTDFAPGETIYPFFQLRYSNGDPISTGQFRVAVKNPSGATVASLTATYESSRFGFYSQTGFTISAIDPGGAWSLEIEADSLSDDFGNAGPGVASSYRVQVVVASSPLSLFLYLVIGLVALLGGAVFLKRYRSSLVGFERLDHLMGGQLPRASSILLLGDPGSGKTVLSNQLLWEELEAGKQCALLSYDAFPEDVQARMKEFGWDITRYLRKGRLKIIDCYSGLTGEGQGAIRDPSDLTELNIQVTSFIGKAKGGPVTIILDSLTPIFNGVDAKQAINFVQTVGAKVKKTGGLLILTASSGAVPVESVAKIKTMVDGVIELALVRSGHQVSRYLSVVKMERRRILPNAVPIEIDRRRGLVFRVSRLETAREQLTKALPFYPRESEAQPAATHGQEHTSKPPPVSNDEKSGKPITSEPDQEQHASSGLHRTGTQRRERDESRGS